MNVKVFRVDLSRVEEKLERIALALEGLLESSNPANKLTEYMPMPDEPKARIMYTNEREDIVREHMARMGKVYKPAK